MRESCFSPWYLWDMYRPGETSGDQQMTISPSLCPYAPLGLPPFILSFVTMWFYTSFLPEPAWICIVHPIAKIRGLLFSQLRLPNDPTNVHKLCSSQETNTPHTFNMQLSVLYGLYNV